MVNFFKTLVGAGVQVCLLAAIPLAVHATVITVSTGYNLPQDILSVPAGFGTIGGSYFITDSSVGLIGDGAVFDMGVIGASPTVFENLGNFLPIGGVFLPSNYGALSGQLLLAGLNNTSPSNLVDEVAALSSSGVVTPLEQGLDPLIFTDVAIAPAGFDGVGGEVVMGNEVGGVFVLNTDGSISLLGAAGSLPYGLAFAPAGFGADGGSLLFSSADSNAIYAMSPNGTLSAFASIPFGVGQSGLRQMAFAPPGFGPYGGDLLVSVSGSTLGGGIAGSVDVVNSAGQVVAYLSEGTAGGPYDPRGIYFLDSSTVLIADSDPSILSAAPTDFTPGNPATPEPSTMVAVLLGLAVLAVKKQSMR